MLFESLQDLEVALGQAGLGQWSDKLLPLARPVALLAPASRRSRKSAVGRTRMGGAPDLPPSMSWPIRAAYPKDCAYITNPDGYGCVAEVAARELPLSFLAQINLTELSKRAPLDGAFPKSGMLYFFFDAIVAPWGSFPSDRIAWQVLHWDGDFSELRKRTFPSSFGEEGRDDKVRFEEFALEPHAGFAMPAMYAIQLDGLGQAHPDWLAPDGRFVHAYVEFCVENGADFRTGMHWFGGYPMPHQNPMEPECEQTATREHGDALDDIRIQPFNNFIPRQEGWRLLLQLDSDEDAGMYWTATGRLFFWILEQDLAARRFDKVWCIMQVT